LYARLIWIIGDADKLSVVNDNEAFTVSRLHLPSIEKAGTKLKQNSNNSDNKACIKIVIFEDYS
jgi:hypothetical protein